MKKATTTVFFVLFLSIIFAGCTDSREKAPLSTPEIRAAIDARDSFVILFFYDPSTGTSQAQLEVLNNVKRNHSDSVIILPYAVDNPESFKAREGYKVRTTPTTVLIDDEGYIIRTFTKITYENMIEEMLKQS